jgi:hypothetical protein
VEAKRPMTSSYREFAAPIAAIALLVLGLFLAIIGYENYYAYSVGCPSVCPAPYSCTCIPIYHIEYRVSLYVGILLSIIGTVGLAWIIHSTNLQK